MLIIAACGGAPPNDPLGSDFMGTWRTDAPKYQDCYIEISEDLLVLGNKEHNPAIYYVKSIKRENENSLETYTLICNASDGVEFLFSLSIETDAIGTVLKLRNKDEIAWRKTLE